MSSRSTGLAILGVLAIAVVALNLLLFADDSHQLSQEADDSLSHRQFLLQLQQRTLVQHAATAQPSLPCARVTSTLFPTLPPYLDSGTPTLVLGSLNV
jgi:hypothetical protein